MSLNSNVDALDGRGKWGVETTRARDGERGAREEKSTEYIATDICSECIAACMHRGECCSAVEEAGKVKAQTSDRPTGN